MNEVFTFLKERYYSVCARRHPEMVPTDEQILQMLEALANRTIVLRNPEIVGVAIYLTLEYKTFLRLKKDMITDVNKLVELFKETGTNFHFILVAGSGVRNIILGIEEAKKRQAKSVSWFNPDMTYLHKYNLN